MNEELQEKYQAWVKARLLIEAASSPRGISEASWVIRQNAWNEYCAMRDKLNPSKKRVIYHSIYQKAAAGE